MKTKSNFEINAGKDFPESGDTLQPGSQMSLNVLIIPSCLAFGTAGAEYGIGSQYRR